MSYVSTEMPYRELVQRIQQGPGAEAAFETLFHRQIISELKHRQNLKGLTEEDKEDVFCEFMWKVWRGIKKFEYKSDGEFESWLFTVLQNTIIDHQRRQKRLREKLPSISLNEKVKGHDGDACELGELISCPDDDVTEQEQREYVLEVAEQCLCEEQLELVKLRLTGQSLPSKWSRSWIDTTWHRVKKILIAEIKKRNAP
jgi:RNA polymerase sigma factor (sigma-70 family)